ncbi:hypothetical protein BDZ89DRAFT_1080640, partial [Hymenopellis radicata]
MGDDPRASEKRITATTRQLESMIRLSEGHARMRLSAFCGSRRRQRGVQTDAGGQRKLRDDMRKEILNVSNGSGGARGIKWADAIKALGGQSSIK